MKKIYLIICAISSTFMMNAQIEGTWKLANQAGALGVGPGLGDISWWSNSIGDLTARACLFDDSVTFNANGSFMTYQNNSTWIEQWQLGLPPNPALDACGTPVAPHNGSNPATWAYNSASSELTLNGVGAFIGLAKAINGAEINNPANAPASVTYLITFLNGGNTMVADISIGGGYWRFVYEKTQIVTAPNPNVTFRVNMSNYTGTIGTGVYVNGTFNSFCGACNPMTNIGGNIWEVVLPLPAGPIQYIFTVDEWTDQEVLVAGGACNDPVVDEYENRYLNVTADVVLPSVCYESCVECLNIGLSEMVSGEVLLMPNPAKSTIQLTSTENMKKIEIIDAQGKSVKTVNCNTTEMNISLDGLNAGFYTVAIGSDKGTITRKLIIE
jgi:hypothetical protein